MNNKSLATRLLPLTAAAILAGCSAPQTEIIFSKDIQPILNKTCVECHQVGGKGYEEAGLNLGSYDGVMKGTKYGPVIEPGNSVSSTLVRLIEGRADPSLKMPHGDSAKALTQDEINLIKKWIEQGAQKN